MVSIDNLKKGLAAYLDKEFIPSIPCSDVKRFAISGLAVYAILKFEVVVENLKANEIVKLFGVFDESGNVDIENLKSAYSTVMPAEGVDIDIPIVGVVNIKKDDIDKLYGYISK